MSDQRISQLTKLNQADVAANDVLPIVDVGSSITKKVEVKELFQAGASLANASSIDLSKLNQASATKLGTVAFADDSVTAAKLADDSAIAYESVAPAVDNFQGRGYVNSASKNLQVWDGSAYQQVVMPSDGIADGAIVNAKLADGAITTLKVDAAGLGSAAIASDAITTAKVADAAITADKLASLSVTTSKIAANAVTAAELADDSVDTGALVNSSATEAKIAANAISTVKIQDGAVTNDKVANTSIVYGKLNLADGSVPGGKIQTSSITSAQLAADAVGTSAIADLSVATAKIADGAVTTAKLADGAITTAKINSAGIGSAAIATSAVTTAKVQDGAITASKMAADSTTIVNPGTPVGSGAYEGQHWFDTNTSVEYIWNSTDWIRQAAINTVTFSGSTPIAFSAAYPDQASVVITATLDTQEANTVFAGPSSGADGTPDFRDLVPADLPNATATTAGIVQPGTGLSVNAGMLNHANSVTPGIYTKLTIDAEGHVDAGALLEATDIPALDAAKITTGELPTARIADDAITIAKLADYSTASLSETFPVADFIGQLHLNPLDKSFFMWDGNIWVPIGISTGQIIFAGTFDASSPAGVGKVASVTPEGAAVGFAVNSPIPLPTVNNNRFYFVVSKGGTITSGNAPNVTLAPPDIILSVYNTSGAAWVEVDVSSGAGAIAASQVSFTSTGAIGSSNVQSAIEEVSTECRNADNISSGLLAVARGGTGNGSYTKGDLLAASGAAALSRLTVGANGQVLRANSATATGLEWGADFVGTVTTVSSSTAALTVASGTTAPVLALRAATTSVDGIVQLSDSVSTTSSSLAATATAVKTAYDLANGALPRAGGTITGDITIGANIGIQFEGTTDDGNEIRLIAADATADRTITLPNVTGTVITTGDSGTVTSTMIADATIVNADISASAAIAHSKLANITAGSVLLGNASNVPTATALSGDITISNTGVTAIASGVIVNADINNSAAIALSKLATGPLPSGITVNSANIVDLSIANDDISASAAIAGTKISPDFGSQNILTTGTSTAGSFIPTSSSAPANGMFLPAANTVAWATNSVDRARIDSSGRLLVGVSSTTVTASVVVQGSSGGNATGRVFLAHTGSTPADNDALGALDFSANNHIAGARIVARRDGGTWTAGSSHPTNLEFATTPNGSVTPAVRMSVKSDGNVYVNGSLQASPSESDSTGIRFYSYGALGATNNGNAALLLRRAGSNGNIAAFYRSGLVGTISVTTTATAYNTSSDYRLKENVAGLDGAIDRIKQLKPSRFNFIADPDTVVDGFIAHEAAEVVPECVTGEKDEVDESGNPVYQGIDQSKLVPLLTAGLQEAISRIEALETKVEALEAA